MPRFLVYNELKEKGVLYSKPHTWRLIREGKFPPPVKGLAAFNVWSEDEIDKFVAERLAEAHRQAAALEAKRDAERAAKAAKRPRMRQKAAA